MKEIQEIALEFCSCQGNEDYTPLMSANFILAFALSWIIFFLSWYFLVIGYHLIFAYISPNGQQSLQI